MKIVRRIVPVLTAVWIGLGLTGLPLPRTAAAEPVSADHGRLARWLAVDDSGETEDLPAWTVGGVLPDTTDPRLVETGRPSSDNGDLSRVYRTPDATERELMVQGMQRRIRTMSAGDLAADLPVLTEYARLSGAGLGLPEGDSLDGEIPLPDDAVDEIEPNDDWASAQPLAFGDTLGGAGAPFSDIDVFSFDGAAGQYVVVDAVPLDGVYGDGYTVVRLFAPDSTEVFGGFYPLEYSARDVSVDAARPLIWPGGNFVSASLDASGAYHVVVETFPGNIRWLDGALPADDAREYDEVEYRLTLDTLATGRLDGRVVDDGGMPVARASVELYNQGRLGGARTETGDDGRFELNLPAGAWGVSVQGPAGGPYPDHQPQHAIEFDGGSLKIELTLRRGVAFAGTTVTDRGEITPRVGISLISAEGRQYRYGQSDEDGEFSVAVFPDTFDIHLHTAGVYPPQPVVEDVAIVADTAAYELVLDSGLRVDGTLVDADGEAVGDGRITFRGDRMQRYVVTDANGGFEVALTAGEYAVEFNPGTGMPIPHQRLGPFPVRSDTTLRLELQAGAVLSGEVYDDRGSPVAGAQVTVGAVHSTADPSDSVFSDSGIMYFEDAADGHYPDLVDPSYATDSERGYAADGHYTFYTDREGRWQGAVSAGSYALSVVAPYPYPSQRVDAGVHDLEERDRVDIGRVEIDYGVLFSGTVLVGSGEPLAHSGFNVHPAKRADDVGDDSLRILPIELYRSIWVRTDGSGGFSMQAPAGTYDLLFEPRYGSQQYPRQWVRGVELDTDREMTIELSPGSRVSGRVVDNTGSGVARSSLDFFRAEGGSWTARADTEADGAFDVRLPDGEYNVIVSPAKGWFVDSAYYALAVRGNTSLEITVTAGVQVSGLVAAEDGHPLGGIQVQLLPHGMRALPRPDPADSLPTMRPALASYAASGADDSRAGIAPGEYYPPHTPNRFAAVSGEDGGWRMIVRPGVYDVFAVGRGEYVNTFLPSIDVSEERELNITLRRGEIVFEGTVIEGGGRPASGALVSLFDRALGDHVSSFTDEHGRFRLDLPGGDYEVFVQGAADSDRLPVAERMKLDSDSRVTIELGSGIRQEGDRPGSDLPRAFALGQNRPNPFNPSTTISYELERDAAVNLSVYDLRGRRVATLVDSRQPEGVYHVQWDGTAAGGGQLASGVYIYRLRAGDFEQTRKMVLLK